MSKETLKLALEALEAMQSYAASERKGLRICDDAITALREALAEPQEKYIYGTPLLDAMTGKANEALDKKAENARELGLDYEMPITMQEGEFDCTHAERLCAELKAAHPVAPCTHPSLGACSLREDGTASRWNCVMCGTEFVPKATNRWAEFNEATKQNIKHAEWYLSTHPQPAQQEPVAWMTKTGSVWKTKADETDIPLYTSPPAQRTWVGLTDEEINAALDYWSEDERSAYGGAHAADGEYVSMIDTWRYIEAKLKEKNNA